MAEVNSEIIHVAVAAITNSKGEVLVSQRLQGTHLEGYWEFPGGKLEHGEAIEAALQRELQEELGITATAYSPLIKVRHCYPEKQVLLDVWRIDAFQGQPHGLEGQPVEWRNITQLNAKDFPPADVPIISALRLPDCYLITGRFADASEFEHRLKRALDKGIRLVQLRLTHEWLQKNNEAEACAIIDIARRLCEQHSARLLLNSPQRYYANADSGIHLNSKQLMALTDRPATGLLSASCHNREQLQQAQAMGADLVLLSPVQFTKSHPDAEPLGWQVFSELVDTVNVPVYALGGVSTSDIPQARSAGAQGVAAISALW
jgi:8-oxo-dGTP diphosphatase